MFLGERLGAARDNFSTNLARLKNLRQRLADVHRARDAVLRQAIETSPEPKWMQGIDLHWLAQEQREWLLNEHNTTLEMMFIYLVSMLDVFFGQWGMEHQLWREDTWPVATPENFQKAGLTMRPAAERQLIEYRARRNVLVHRGGIADTEYCECVQEVQDKTRPGQRLPVDESYFDKAADFVDHLAAATSVAKYAGPSRHEARDWSSLIDRVFVSVTSPASRGKARGHKRGPRSEKSR